MNPVSQRLIDAYRKSGLSYPELEKITGIPKSSIQRYITGMYEDIPMSRLEKIADALNVSAAYIMGWEDELPSNIVPIHRRMIPVLGNVAAGQPIWADEEHDEYVDDNGTKGADFALRVKGDSMSPLIEDGDFVYVHRQPTVRNGQIAVVIDGDSATLKYVYINNDGVQLASHNPKYAPMVYTGDAAAQLHIAGLAIAYRRSLIQK